MSEVNIFLDERYTPLFPASVPIQIVQYALASKMQMALGLFLLLKASCNGHAVLTEAWKAFLMNALGIKTARSFHKYFHRLIEENWIGLDHRTNTVYIRSFRLLRIALGFYNSTTVEFDVSKDSSAIKEFSYAAILCSEVKRRLHARKAVIIKKAGRSALKNESALQELSANKLITAYIGISVDKLGDLWNVSKSQADRIKKRLILLEYIRREKPYVTIHTSDKPDFAIFKNLPANRRYELVKRKCKGTILYKFRERTFDEISCMKFKVCSRPTAPLISRLFSV